MCNKLLNYLSGISLQDITSIFQIAFFIIGSTIAILTYRSAKKGLLNTVNTEYQKRVMDKLEILSTRLYEELNPESDKYWLKTSRLHDNYFDDIVDGYLNREKFKANAYHDIGVPEGIFDDSIEILINDVKTDPFLPESIVEILTKKIGEKQLTRKLIFFEAIQLFKKDLKDGKFDNEMENATFALHTYIFDKTYEAQCSLEHIESEVHNVRSAIREYLDKFNPFN